MQTLTFADQVMLIIIAAAVGFGAKVGWDWLNSRGKDNAGLFMSKASCKAIRNDCGVKEFKKEYTEHRSSVLAHTAKIDQQLHAIEKQLVESGLDTKALRADIIEIKEALSGLIAVMGMRHKGERAGEKRRAQHE